jgi:hypothetical protein
MDAKLSKEYWNSQWRRRLSQLVARHRRGAALRMLNRLIENSLPLFSNDPRVIEERRIAWLFKIDLLREMKQLSEALAWVCLECELVWSGVSKNLSGSDLFGMENNAMPNPSSAKLTKPCMSCMD